MKVFIVIPSLKKRAAPCFARHGTTASRWEEFFNAQPPNRLNGTEYFQTIAGCPRALS